MAGFLYFTPRLGGLGQFQSANLGYAFDGPPAITEVGNALGPQGLPGVVYHAPGIGMPGRIEWHLMAAHWWCGYAAGRKPTPEDMEFNANRISLGYKVKLGDGQDWAVPVVAACTDRDPKRVCGLPQVYKLATGAEVPEGQPVPGFLLPTAGVHLEVASEFAGLVADANLFLANLEGALGEGEKPAPIGQAETLNFCTACLAVSYRMRVHECIALGLFAQESVNEIVFAAIDAQERFESRAVALANLAEAAA